jgi:hypothetical protein
MKTLSIISLLLLLTNCAGGNMAKMKIGKRCTVSDTNQLQESSYIWFVGKVLSRILTKESINLIV